ncbi:B-cell receptor CD22-like [Discoglossus pictus]
MKLLYNPVERSLLLFVFQVCSQYSACQDWSFSFPESVQALKGSCVEIPCTFTHPANYGEIRLIWYLYHITTYPQVFNQKNSSAVLPEYKGRTSLVGNAPNSCTLRINNVINGDWYYPGISTRINSWFTNNIKKTVQVKVTESANEPLLQEVKDLTEGVTVTISCSVDHTCRSNPPFIEWNYSGEIRVEHGDLSGGTWRYISKLQYNPSHKDDKTHMECKVTYPNIQIKKKRHMLNIKYSAKNVNINQRKAQVKEGAVMELMCQFVKCNPAPTHYSWYMDGIFIKTETGQFLRLSNIKITQSGNYSCVVHNEAGDSYSLPVRVTVTYPAKDVQIKQSKIQLNDEEVIEFECQFSRINPEPKHYAWYMDGIKLINETGQTMRLVSTEMAQHGKYSCVVHNEAGNSSSLPVTINTGSHIYIYIIVSVVVGIFCLLLIILFYLRKRKSCTSGNERNSATCEQSTNATYAELLKRDISPEYDVLKPRIDPQEPVKRKVLVTTKHGNISQQT